MSMPKLPGKKKAEDEEAAAEPAEAPKERKERRPLLPWARKALSPRSRPDGSRSESS